MMLRVHRQKAQEVGERHAPENGVVDMRPSGVGGRREIRFEITYCRFQSSQQSLK